MPLLARTQPGEHGPLVRTALFGSVIAGTSVVTAVTGLTWLLAIRLLGPSFTDVPALVVLLAPGAVLLGCNQVLGDVLRGKDRPFDVARCEAVGLLMTAILLLVLVPHIAARGAAIASTVAYAFSFLFLLRMVKVDSGGGTAH